MIICDRCKKNMDKEYGTLLFEGPDGITVEVRNHHTRICAHCKIDLCRKATPYRYVQSNHHKYAIKE